MSGVNGTNYDEDEGYITLPGGAIYGWTRQYHLFEFDPANRDVIKTRVDEKRKMIREGKDYLRECPIIVQDVNGRWIVRDGQHRKEAAMLEGVVLYYILSDRVSSDDVIEINNSQHGWSINDRMKHFLALDKPEYKMLAAFRAKYPWIPLPVVVNLCHYGDRAKMGFNDGSYVANDMDFAESVAQLCLALKPYTDLYCNRPFIESIVQCLELEGFEPERLVRKAALQPGEIKRHGRVEQYMQQWDGIYNKYQKEENILKIEKVNSGSKRRRADRRRRNMMGVK